ncbi:ABC1-domain-containing protein [Mycena vulgaris]|nr:ABC1-domain-containing protein [Mycena vulgaris]
MPPGPAFNWLCVASSACDILVHVARIRASQIASEGALANTARSVAKNRYKAAPDASSTRERREHYPVTSGKGSPADELADASVAAQVEIPALDTEKSLRTMAGPSALQYRRGTEEGSTRNAPLPLVQPEATPVVPGIRLPPNMQDVPFTPLAKTDAPVDLSEAPANEDLILPEVIELKRTSEPAGGTPSESLGNSDFTSADVLELERGGLPLECPHLDLLDYSTTARQLLMVLLQGLAASLGYGAASEIIRRTASPGSEGPQQSVMMTEANITRLVSKLSQMRGAALKLGQFLSIQDTHVLPADVDKIFRRVQDSAHYMPDWQMEQVLSSGLGPEWERLFTSFDRVPFAAASIGQVHTATLAAEVSPTGAPARVAVKIQFPNIANSIASDLGYISLLLTAGRLLPKGLFLERTMQVMKAELADECDYTREAGFLRTFGAHLGGDSRFTVPWVWDGSTERVLVMEHLDGTSVGAVRLDQRDRNDIAARIIELCLKELFEFRLMQTDPNWSNFLWNARTRRVELVDFGATRAYSREFIDGWLRLLQAAAADDRAACIEQSLKLGYLTGEENQVMLDAHVDTMTLLAMPFKPGTPQPFAFGQGTAWADATAQIRAQIPVMLQHRLTPPPQETYSLNRKLSGAFLLAARLDAAVDTRAIWDGVVSKYEFTT